MDLSDKMREQSEKLLKDITRRLMRIIGKMAAWVLWNNPIMREVRKRANKRIDKFAERFVSKVLGGLVKGTLGLIKTAFMLPFLPLVGVIYLAIWFKNTGLNTEIHAAKGINRENIDEFRWLAEKEGIDVIPLRGKKDKTGGIEDVYFVLANKDDREKLQNISRTMTNNALLRIYSDFAEYTAFCEKQGIDLNKMSIEEINQTRLECLDKLENEMKDFDKNEIKSILNNTKADIPREVVMRNDLSILKDNPYAEIAYWDGYKQAADKFAYREGFLTAYKNTQDGLALSGKNNAEKITLIMESEDVLTKIKQSAVERGNKAVLVHKEQTAFEALQSLDLERETTTTYICDINNPGIVISAAKDTNGDIAYTADAGTGEPLEFNDREINRLFLDGENIKAQEMLLEQRSEMLATTGFSLDTKVMKFDSFDSYLAYKDDTQKRAEYEKPTAFYICDSKEPMNYIETTNSFCSRTDKHKTDCVKIYEKNNKEPVFVQDKNGERGQHNNWATQRLELLSPDDPNIKCFTSKEELQAYQVTEMKRRAMTSAYTQTRSTADKTAQPPVVIQLSGTTQGEVKQTQTANAQPSASVIYTSKEEKDGEDSISADNIEQDIDRAVNEPEIGLFNDGQSSDNWFTEDNAWYAEDNSYGGFTEYGLSRDYIEKVVTDMMETEKAASVFGREVKERGFSAAVPER